MVRKSLIVTALLAVATPLAAQDEEQWVWTSDRPDAVAPLGVMGAHTLAAGQFEISYQWVQRNYEGTWFGKASLDLATTLQLYEVAPLSLSDKRHQVGVAFGVTDDLTIRARGEFSFREREQLRDDGTFYITSDNALGDAEVDATLNVLRRGPYRMDVNAGASIPLASPGAYAVTPFTMPNVDVLSYDMRPGTGSFGLFGSVSMNAQNEFGSVGAQFGMRTYVNENNRGFTWGDRYHFNAWAALKLNDDWSVSGGARWEKWANIDGTDDQLGTRTGRDPMYDGVFLGGIRGIFPFGINLVIPDGMLAGHRLSFETQYALHHDYDGPQIGMDWGINLGWSAPF